MGKLSEDLRECARCRGIAVTTGYVTGDGSRHEEERVTTLWPVEGDARQSVTFQEMDHELFCDDGLTVEQALALALMAVPLDLRKVDG